MNCKRVTVLLTMSMENVKVICKHEYKITIHWDKTKQIALDVFFLYFMQFSWRSDPVYCER